MHELPKTPEQKNRLQTLDESLHTAAKETRQQVATTDRSALELFAQVLGATHEITEQTPDAELWQILLNRNLPFLQELPNAFQAPAILAQLRIAVFSADSALTSQEKKALQQGIIEQETALAAAYDATALGQSANRMVDNTQDLVTAEADPDLPGEPISELQAFATFERTLQEDSPKAIAFVQRFLGTSAQPGELLTAQDARLQELFMSNNPDIQQANDLMRHSAIGHIAAVDRLGQQLNPDSILTRIATLLHDYFKHGTLPDGKGRVLLAEHEVASSAMAAEIASQIAEEFCRAFPQAAYENQLEQPENETRQKVFAEKLSTALSKLLRKLTSIHGEREFPFVVSSNNPVFSAAALESVGAVLNDDGLYELTAEQMTQLKNECRHRRLFGGVYFRSETSDSIIYLEDSDDSEFRKVGHTLSIADELTGAHVESLKKYNFETGDAVLLMEKSLAEYIAKRTLASMVGCFHEATLRKHGWEQLPEIVKMKDTASLLLLMVINGTVQEEYIKKGDRDVALLSIQDLFTDMPESLSEIPVLSLYGMPGIVNLITKATKLTHAFYDCKEQADGLDIPVTVRNTFNERLVELLDTVAEFKTSRANERHIELLNRKLAVAWKLLESITARR